MPRTTIRCYAELNDFLAPERRGRSFTHEWLLPATVKDVIESFGIPHTEVDLILANGEAVKFDYRIADGDFISVYPVFEAFDIAPVERLRPEPLRDPRFVLDSHLGRLAAYLRMLGFDALYRNCAEDAWLARVSSGERRILLTRDVGLLKRSEVTHGHWLRETDSRAQLREVVSRYHLSRLVRPFTRCMRCNESLRPIPAEEAATSVPPGVLKSHTDFRACPGCGRVYWQGSHWRRMTELMSQL